jgi:hypothetical protein
MRQHEKIKTIIYNTEKKLMKVVVSKGVED